MSDSDRMALYGYVCMVLAVIGMIWRVGNPDVLLIAMVVFAVGSRIMGALGK